jgi:hypothetical protein
LILAHDRKRGGEWRHGAMDLICLSTSALFEHVNLERSYLGLRRRTPLAKQWMVLMKERKSS